jgi:hypothetical protein
MAAVAKKSLSTESPPFNPRIAGGNRSPVPPLVGAKSPYRSRSTSPFRQRSGVSNSNAVAKYEFEYDGYVVVI